VPSVKLNPHLRAFSQQHALPRIDFEFWRRVGLPAKIEEMSFEHFLVPKHVLISKEQAAELLKKYNLTLDLLPKISKDDAAMIGLNPEKNDLVKIVRNSPTAGKTVYYRRVV
jgi:DNA-directed RNA polymerase subunit H